jgi:signal peptidase I
LIGYNASDLVTESSTPASFRPAVELALAEPVEARKARPGRDIALIARFRDFLGEPTSDAGELTLSTSKGVLIPAGSDVGGDVINLAPRAAPIDERGELPVILRAGQERGKAEVRLSCKLGEARLIVDLPRAAGFALTEVLESVIFAFLVAILIRIFFFQTFWIPSGSMEPTLYQGDRIIANKLVYRLREPERGEVVIFRVFQPGRRGSRGSLTLEEAYATAQRSERFLSGHLGETGGESRERAAGKILVQDYIKRVVGLAGDVVEVEGRVIYVNGEALQEPFETRPPDYDHYGPITVPSGEVFVMGDNRSNSQDSHVIGTVPIRNIEGRAEVVFWPPSRVRLIPQGG